MESTKGMRLTLTRLACKQAVIKGFTAEQIQEAFDQPEEIQANESRPGQYRIAKDGVVIVGVPVSDTEFRGIIMGGKR